MTIFVLWVRDSVVERMYILLLLVGVATCDTVWDSVVGRGREGENDSKCVSFVVFAGKVLVVGNNFGRSAGNPQGSCVILIDLATHHGGVALLSGSFPSL